MSTENPERYELNKPSDKNRYLTFFHGTTDIKPLPFTHKCSWFEFPDYLNSRCILPTKCRVFYKKLDSGDRVPEELCYLFYGRNDYRIGYESNTRPFYPICFVFDSMSIQADVAFPFDSGGYAYKRYQLQIPSRGNNDINIFSFPPTIENILQFVSVVYGSNENYLSSNPQIDEDPENMSIMEIALLTLYKNSKKESFDNRANCIEIITRNAVPFDESLKAIILPLEAANSAENKPALDYLVANGLKLLTYNPDGCILIEDLHKKVKQELKKYYVSEGILWNADVFDE